MARKAASPGVCAFCAREMAAAGVAKHLAVCAARLAAIDKAEASKRKSQSLYHLIVRDAVDGTYWLHLEAPAATTLQDLDAYLRAIWVDCCGHMSHFVFGTTRYQELIDGFFALGDQKSITTRIGDVLRPGLKGKYEYDFGAPTELNIEVVGVREGKPLTTKPIVLLARNIMPAYLCAECGAPATHVCMQCYFEIGEPGCYLCADHARQHGCTLYGGPKRRFNSPRTGRCKYNGPAKPPY
ncbi:MAG TPA: plasmid pRiA4b ORF-3 family protein [Chloroflexi bacterium]|nr:plasmid pRiA4b ORF-3 family protein [Chloroflexota bacterium]